MAGRPMNVIEGRFDRRATHRIISEPVAVGMTLDTLALADEGMTFLSACNWIALAIGDKDLVRGINRAHSCFAGIREIARQGAALIENSTAIEPYEAVRYAGLEVA
jgi:hypothetical protein